MALLWKDWDFAERADACWTEVSGTSSWKQEMMRPPPHLFWTDGTNNVVSKHESRSVTSPSAVKMLGHSLGILEYKR